MTNDNGGHDAWDYSPPKLPKASAIKLGDIYGVQPFDGVRNPGFRSSTSHTIWLTYKTAANDWQPKVAICESAAEAAVAIEVLLSPDIHDVSFQPLTVKFEIDGKSREYTHDLLMTFKSGRRSLVFVRNGESLSRPKTWREISAIREATPPTAANDLVVIDADDYSRQRRENLFRMHEMVQQTDQEADDLTLFAAENLSTLWQIKDIFPHVALPQRRVFRACLRLIARKKLTANMDNVILETSCVQVAA
ncbi:hypothetical protein C1J03_18715 [Sulfitobacter sp. SK012]|nr:hypothetical protein C1J03_18715 [Sulfitobacter sp. SK012]